MFEVRVEAGFSATHQVRLPNGRLEPMHGHDWRVTAVFRGRELDARGMLVDFVIAQEALRDIVAALQHTHLNGHALLRAADPTAEHVARSIYDSLVERMGKTELLAAVLITEAPGCSAGYTQARYLDDI